MWTITQKDLDVCRSKVQEQAQKDRNDVTNKIQKEVMRLDEKVDSTHTDIALLNQSAKHMQKDITDIKISQKEGFDKITKAIESLDTKFATKAEFEKNKDRIDWFTKFAWIVGSIIITAILWGILKVILI